MRRALRRRAQHRAIVAAEADPPQRGDVGPLVRRQHGLREATVGKRLHLGEALQRRPPRIGNAGFVLLRGKVAFREAAVVMRRSRQAVEVHFHEISRVRHHLSE